MLACTALAFAFAFAPRPALADDRASIESGRAAGRAIVLLREPRGCAIALLRDRCVADVDAFLHGRGDGDFTNIPNVGPHPASGLRAFVADGDRDGFDGALAWINNRQATAAQWTANPRDAALYDAGVLDVFLAAAGPDDVRQMLAAAPAADLAMHAAEIPADALPVDVAPLRALHMTRPNALVVLPFARDLVRAVRRSMPPPRLAGVAGDGSPTSDAALGVTVATMSELIDAWQWGLQADAQSFSAALADRLEAVVPAVGRPFVVSFRAKAQPAPGTAFDRVGAANALTSALAVYTAVDPHARAERVGLGSAAAQLAYNAASARDAATARNLLTVLAGTETLDAAIPGWQAARVAGGSIEPSNWRAQHTYALRLVDLVQKANGT